MQEKSRITQQSRELGDLKKRNEKNMLFPWYDSYWLHSYVLVKQYIQKTHPSKIKQFVQEMDVLRTHTTFKTIEQENLFSEIDHQQMRRRVAEIKSQEFEKHEFLEFGRIIKHDDPLFNKLQAELVIKVSELVGEEVEASYNFLSMYNNLGILNPHMDAPNAKWTVDYCIEQSSPWPIKLSKVLAWPEEFNDHSEHWVEHIKNDLENEFSDFQLEERKAIIFSGSSQWHYRDRIQQLNKANYCNLVFFHFIPKGTKKLAHPRNWAAHFGIPELTNLVIDE